MHAQSPSSSSAVLKSMGISLVLLASFATSALADGATASTFRPPTAPQTAWRAPVPGEGIQWTPCEHGLQCGRLLVPLDYANTSRGVADLAVARFPAANTSTRVGTLFINPGGPGGSGVAALRTLGRLVGELLEGRYDIASWDPRGVGGTLPRLQCFESQTAQDLLIRAGPALGARDLAQRDEAAVFAHALRALGARTTLVAARCANTARDALEFMDTATVARDLERLAAVIDGEDAPVNYWGFSYGTALGAYFVNMFPKRVGRVVLDGNLDTEAWANGVLMDWYKYSVMDTNKAFHMFVNQCAKAGPERCALATKDSTPESIANSIDALLDDLYDWPLPVPDAKLPGVVTMSHVQELIFLAMYRPAVWPYVATTLAALQAGNGTAFLDENGRTVELDTSVAADTVFAVFAIVCADAPPVEGTPQDEIERMADAARALPANVTRRFTPGWETGCAPWAAVRPKARFTGPFNETLANTILVIGNTADPVTPLRNARLVRERLGASARLLVQDGAGHCSPAQPSACTGAALRAYFFRGELPRDGLVCPVSGEAFPAPGEGAFAQVHDAEERETLERLAAIGDAIWPSVRRAGRWL